MAIHDKILIPRFTAAAAATVTVKREKQNRFLKYYSPRSVLLFHMRQKRPAGIRSCHTKEFSPDTSNPAHLSLSPSLFSFLSFFFLSGTNTSLSTWIESAELCCCVGKRMYSSPSTNPLVFYVKTEQFYFTS